MCYIIIISSDIISCFDDIRRIEDLIFDGGFSFVGERDLKYESFSILPCKYHYYHDI